MKLTEIVQNIKSVLYNNRVPNTYSLDDRQIVYWLNNQRALWLRREYNQMREIHNNEKQILYDVELEVVSSDIYPIGIDNNNTLLRSKFVLPRTIQTHIGDGIIAVRGKNKLMERINYCSREDAVYKGNGWFNKSKLFAFKDDDRLWIKYGINADKNIILTNAQIEGVFENPIDVDIYNGTPTDIRFGVTEYPISNAFIDFIESEIFKLNIQRFVSDGNPNDQEDTNRIN